MAGFERAVDLRDAVRAGDASAVEVCRAALERLERIRPLNAVLAVGAEQALARAEALDRTPPGARTGVLFGVPVVVKDNLATSWLPTTAGSRILEGYVPPYNATVIDRLEAAGAIVLGKANCDEFAMGSSNENSAFGPARNPWDPTRAPGGSSGGSAVVVSARAVPLSLGSDTGGSVRQPAALTGVVGLKPTYGRVSRYGLLAFASSLDQIGPFATNVADAAACLAAIAGQDPRDATSAGAAVPDYGAALTGEVEGLRIGVPRHLLAEGVDQDVLASFETAIMALQDAGATVVEVALPHSRYAIPVYYLVATAEASSNLSRYDGVRYGMRAAGAASLGEMYDRTRDEGFGAEVKRRIILGTYVLSAGYYDAYYLKAQQVRTLIRRDYDAAFEQVDVVAMPTTPTPAFELGARTASPLQMYLSDVFTVTAPLAGLPAISVPAGFSAAGLPIGLQLTARALDEPTLLRAADAYERLTPFARQRPPHAADR
jgi:aspartyl-tRNA(Asn)/glutamyl-tRNA(Gln) amidotransferase subunit A